MGSWESVRPPKNRARSPTIAWTTPACWRQRVSDWLIRRISWIPKGQLMAPEGAGRSYVCAGSPGKVPCSAVGRAVRPSAARPGGRAGTGGVRNRAARRWGCPKPAVGSARPGRGWRVRRRESRSSTSRPRRAQAGSRSRRRNSAICSISASAVACSSAASLPSRRSNAARISALLRPLIAITNGKPKRAL
jgi:hypothetical protein